MWKFILPNICPYRHAWSNFTHFGFHIDLVGKLLIIICFACMIELDFPMVGLKSENLDKTSLNHVWHMLYLSSALRQLPVYKHAVRMKTQIYGESMDSNDKPPRSILSDLRRVSMHRYIKLL